MPIEFYAALFSVMLQTPQHTYMILTKRPVSAQRALQSTRKYLDKKLANPFPWPLPNVWIGVSVEDQETADQRIPRLCGDPCHIIFCELRTVLVTC